MIADGAGRVRGGVQVALLAINLDAFALLNETLGLDGADQVL